MRIGILTLPLHTNYGGMLQAYALQTVLERMGHEVKLLNRLHYRRLAPWRLPFAYTKRFIRKYMLRENIHIRQEWYFNRTYPIISQHIRTFVDKYIKCQNINDLTGVQEKDFDAIIVGSDQIWRPSYNKKIEDAYLGFARRWSIKRIAYAASFGTDEWQYTVKQKNICSGLLRRFDAVSVREESGVTLCRKYLGVDAQHVLDPTMLLEADDYVRLIKNACVPQSKGNLLTYILDETLEKKSFIARIAQDKGLTPFQVNNPKVNDINVSADQRIQPSVEQWLRGFYDAKLVITDSFHACAFSIIFNKPFIAIGNKERGMARFLSLLRMFRLEDRLITVLTGNIDIPLTIDNIDMKERLEELRNISYSYLTNSLI